MVGKAVLGQEVVSRDAHGKLQVVVDERFGNIAQNPSPGGLAC